MSDCADVVMTELRYERAARTVSVSLIVPTFNRAHLIGETLQSLIGQTAKPLEFIVIDDGSTDDTEAVVRRSAPDITYLRQENQGKAAALNFALSQASGDYVWVFDDDDLAQPDALAVLLDALERHPECGFAYGGYENFGVSESGERWRYRVETPVVESGELFVALLERCFIFQGAMLVRRSCFEAVGPFDESLIRSQDYEMLLRLSRGFKACRLDEIVYLQRQHASARGTLNNIVAADKVEEAWIKYDSAIMDKIQPTLGDVDYLPSPSPPVLSDEMRALALVQKFTVFARKNMWASAADAMQQFSDICTVSQRRHLHPKESAILSRVFDGYSRAFHSAQEREGLSRSLAQIQSPALRRQVRKSMARPLPFDIRIALRNREKQHFSRRVKALLALRGSLFTTLTLTKITFSITRGRLSGDPERSFAQFKMKLS